VPTSLNKYEGRITPKAGFQIMYNVVKICSPICLMGVPGPLISESAAIWHFIDTRGIGGLHYKWTGYLTVQVHLELIVAHHNDNSNSCTALAVRNLKSGIKG